MTSTTNDPQPSNSKRAVWKVLFTWTVVFVVLICLALTVQKAIVELTSRQDALDVWRLDWRYLLGGLVVYCASLIPPAIGWIQVLNDFRQRLPRLPTLQAYFLGHLGKYVPGKAMVLILRVGKLQPHGLAIRPGIVSVFVETLTGLFVGAILGGVLLLFLDVPPWLKWCSIACLPFAALALTPHFFRIGLFAAAKSKIGKMPKTIPAAFTTWFMARTSFWVLLGWVMQGTAAWLVLLSMSPQPELWTWLGWMSVVSAVCLGAVAGFASMLPGGAVVREIVITWLLAPIVTQPVALLAAIILRLVNLTGESLIVGILFASNKRGPKITTRGVSEE